MKRFTFAVLAFAALLLASHKADAHGYGVQAVVVPQCGFAVQSFAVQRSFVPVQVQQFRFQQQRSFGFRSQSFRSVPFRTQRQFLGVSGGFGGASFQQETIERRGLFGGLRSRSTRTIILP